MPGKSIKCNFSAAATASSRRSPGQSDLGVQKLVKESHIVQVFLIQSRKERLYFLETGSSVIQGVLVLNPPSRG